LKCAGHFPEEYGQSSGSLNLVTEFPQHLLVATSAHCQPRSGPTQQAAITIALHTFLLEGQPVDTCFRLDGIALDLHEPRNHAERCYRFPANPQDGYIDGSVYLQSELVVPNLPDQTKRRRLGPEITLDRSRSAENCALQEVPLLHGE